MGHLPPPYLLSKWQMDEDVVGKTLSTLGKSAAPGLIEHAKEMGVKPPASNSTIPTRNSRHS